MVRVVQTVLDGDAHEWLMALMSLSRRERKESLGKFCSHCGISYRHLYPVVEGRSSISADVLSNLRQRAIDTGIEPIIQEKILARNLGMTNQ